MKQRAIVCAVAAVIVGLVTALPAAALGETGAAAPTWKLQKTRNLSSGGSLWAVSCGARKMCMALGSPNQIWKGRGWATEEIPAPTGTSDVVLSNLACTSAVFCIAVGSEVDSAGVTVALAESWKGVTWSPMEVSLPTGSTSTIFSDISCPAKDFCMAVGSEVDSTGATVDLVEEWDGSIWVLDPSPGSSGGLTSVSCTSTGPCMALGTDVEWWSGSSWTALPSPPNPPSVMSIYPSDVSCASVLECVVVGNAFVPEDEYSQGFGAVWNGSTWSSTLVLGQMVGVSCLADGQCIAVGRFLPPETSLINTIADEYSGDTWAETNPPNPGTVNLFSDVSCTSSTTCTAVGEYTESDANDSLGERYSG